jgi:hypothetical protein
MNSFIPEDKDKNKPSLNNEEMEKVRYLVKNNSLNINRKFIDDCTDCPQYCLFSYITNIDKEITDIIEKYEKDLPPSFIDDINKQLNNTICGVGKIRGAYHTEEDAKKQAENIICNIDSKHSIFTCKVGVPFPIVTQGFSKDVSNVDVDNYLKSNEKNKNLKNKKEITNILHKQEELLNNKQISSTFINMENYITHRVKLAHILYTLTNNENSMKKLQETKKSCIVWLKEAQEKDDTLDKE